MSSSSKLVWESRQSILMWYWGTVWVSGASVTFVFYNVCPTVNFVLLLENFLEAAAEGTLQMAEIFFTAFTVDNNILDIFLIKCELCCMIKLARHLWSKITNVKSNSSNVSVNKYTGDSQHVTTPSYALFKELLRWHSQCFWQWPHLHTNRNKETKVPDC